ncbi:FP25 [Bombyx mandarina nucleopolyhedrovirus]|uniref:25K n=2 Tax=Bombyx mori nuclear polyhedrosis virus TaxID=271108 RepID=Q9YJA4_NPVBM|nr:FP25 [Bombyx mandarina nucleopolyhedrovirus]AFN08978.1 FP25 [Bombyx mori nucleopolyhedrovirus]AFO10021.1 FP25 [Bombyx mandarina nucleopolyhedrovirus S2]AFN21303.1 FP25 [Bombyx mori nucleopolyhedrovirus]AGX01276.1 25K [Bombyx mori nucleopolyhedrovirus]
MDQFEQLINVSLLKSLIKTQIDENVSDNIKSMSEKLKRLECDNLTDSVEIYGIHDNRLNNKKIRNYYLKKICILLDLNFKHVIESSFDKNHIVAKLCDATRAKEWQTKSRERRLKNFNLNINYDGPVKIFVAATAEQKLLLKKTRDALLPFYKYISICKNGVMVRRDEKSRVFIVKNEQNIEYLKANKYYAFHSDSVDNFEFENDSKKMLQNLI